MQSRSIHEGVASFVGGKSINLKKKKKCIYLFCKLKGRFSPLLQTVCFLPGKKLENNKNMVEKDIIPHLKKKSCPFQSKYLEGHFLINLSPSYLCLESPTWMQNRCFIRSSNVLYLCKQMIMSLCCVHFLACGDQWRLPSHWKQLLTRKAMS